jgi:uncharacterized protein YajQ (UPF0234 family)
MAAENSFDIACKIDMQEVTNALDQARREIDTRYDLKGAKCGIAIEKTDITATAPDDMKLKAVVDILQSRLHKRGVPLKALTYGEVEQASGGTFRSSAPRRSCASSRTPRSGCRPRSRKTRCAWPARTATTSRRSSR